MIELRDWRRLTSMHDVFRLAERLISRPLLGFLSMAFALCSLSRAWGRYGVVVGKATSCSRGWRSGV